MLYQNCMLQLCSATKTLGKEVLNSTFDDDLLTICWFVWRTFRYIDNENEGDDDVNERSSDNEEMKKMKSPVIAKCYTMFFIQINTWQLQKLKFVRYKSFNFDVNLIYESKKFNSVRLFFVIWIQNINAIVKANWIRFNSMRHNFDVWVTP